MTDKDSLPVKKMTADTTFRELRSQHRGCPYTDQKRRVRVHRYWNEEYLVVIQHAFSHNINDIFVWQWEECQNPVFRYSHSLGHLYPTGLFPTAFFLWDKYLVMMPETSNLGFINEERKVSSMIRTHDLSDNFRLTGQYDFPEDGPRRILTSPGNENAHLHRLGDDKAVALCRTPSLTFYIFSLPSCSLLKTVPLPQNSRMFDHRPLEYDELDQRFLAKDNTMMFLFHHPDFFKNMFPINDDGPPRYGRLLVVDFQEYLQSQGEVGVMLDSSFDRNDDYVEKVCIVNTSKLLCVTMSGRIIIRIGEKVQDDPKGSTIRFQDRVVIPCPETLKESYEIGLEDLQQTDTDGPNLVTSRSGDKIAVLRHFVSGRKLHCYSGLGVPLYQIQVDNPSLNLEKNPGYLNLDLDGAFLCVADQNKVVIWDSQTGAHINTINIPEHYNYRDDPDESQDKFCWKGHTDFAFTEDGIIVIHSQRNFPIAADVFLFW